MPKARDHDDNLHLYRLVVELIAMSKPRRIAKLSESVVQINVASLSKLTGAMKKPPFTCRRLRAVRDVAVLSAR